MSENTVMSFKGRLFFSFGAMLIIILVLIGAILLFVSFGPGPSWARGITGIILSLITFHLVWKILDDEDKVKVTWMGIFAGMMTWMVIGEISHQFGFVVIEAEGGMAMLVFATMIFLMLWIKKTIPWGFIVYLTSFFLNWWGHALLLPQLYLAEVLDEPIFETTYFLTGVVCLIAFVGLVVWIILKPMTKSRLIYCGLWMYMLLVTSIEGITRITENTFGH